MIRQTITTVFLLTLLPGAAALADDGGWFLGLGRGGVTGNYKVSDFDDGSIISGSVDNSDWGWKAFTGYEFGKYLGLEFGYADLHNDPDEKMTFTGISNGTGTRYVSFPGGEVSVDIDEITTWYAAATLSLPLSPQFSLSAKAGATRWEARRTVIDLDNVETPISGTDALLGVAGEFRFNNGIAIRGEFERFTDLADTDLELVSVSVLYHF